jgi:hypothetical protein
MLYGTDFEAFPVGDNQWAGTENWQSNDMTSGAQGIVADFVSNLPLGRTAYLGFNPPKTAFTTVFRPVNFNPATAQIPVVGFDSLLGIQDSTNGRRDRFYVSFYNIGGNFLASICFDNALGRIFREDGVARFDTGIEFIRGNQLVGLVALQLIEVRIDLVANRWSASLDGIPLFAGASFTASAAPRTLGPVAAEWKVMATSPSLAAGDNWLFVADWYVRSVPEGAEPFEVDSMTRGSSGDVTLLWQGQAGFDYQVLYSSDLATWHDNLPDTGFPGVIANGPLSFTDPAPLPGARFYRIRRAPTP